MPRVSPAQADCSPIRLVSLNPSRSRSPVPTNPVPIELRPARKLLRAVADLHTRGYQRLRIAVFQYELGTWRCYIAPALWISGNHGARLAEGVDWAQIATYTSASEREYWGWKDQHHATPAKLAEVFLDRFPRLAELGYGEDWSYVGWYQHMLHVTYPDAIPVTDLNMGDVRGYMTSLGREVRFALPPAGFGPLDRHIPGSEFA